MGSVKLGWNNGFAAGYILCCTYVVRGTVGDLDELVEICLERMELRCSNLDCFDACLERLRNIKQHRRMEAHKVALAQRLRVPV